MSGLTDAEVQEAIAKIIEKFRVLECEECAREIIEWCAKEGIEATLLQIKACKGRFILSDRWGEKLIMANNPHNESITDNGKHYGVEVRGMVFDNLSTTGITREEWIQDFHSRSGIIVSEL
jgi:Papain fold toxin 2